MLQRLLKFCVPSALYSVMRRRRFASIHHVSRIDSDEVLSIRSSEIGENCLLSEPVTIWRSRVGRFCRIRQFAFIEETNLGAFCSVARGSMIGLGPHPIKDFVSIHPYFYEAKPHLGYPADKRYGPAHPKTNIGSDVWIGAGTKIIAGVDIGHGAVIGSGAVITKNIPPYAIAVGNPGRVIRYRFDKATIEFLLELAWWERDESWLREHWRLFHDVRHLIDKFS